MATKKKMLQAAAGSAGGGGFTAIEDVFSTYLYTGNGSTQTITNGIALSEAVVPALTSHSFGGTEAEVDSQGNYFRVLSSQVIKWSSTGTFIWGKTLLSSSRFYQNIAIDSNDDVIVCQTNLATSQLDVYKFSGTDGTSLWKKTYSNVGDRSSIACFGTRIFIAGASGSESFYGFLIEINSSNGSVISSKYHVSSVFNYDLAIDSTNSLLYVSGNSGLSGTIIKYDISGGGLTFVTSIARYYQNTTIFRSVAVDSSGDVYVTGQTGSGSENCVVKFNSSLTEQWRVFFSTDTNGAAAGRQSIATSDTGKVLVRLGTYNSGSHVVSLNPSTGAVINNSYFSGVPGSYSGDRELIYRNGKFLLPTTSSLIYEIPDSAANENLSAVPVSNTSAGYSPTVGSAPGEGVNHVNLVGDVSFTIADVSTSSFTLQFNDAYEGSGGLVWIKGRNAVTNHALVDTERGGANSLASDTTDAQRTDGAYGLTFNSDGFDSTGGNLNVSGRDQVSWTFRKAPRFFDVVTYTGTGATQTINHGLDCDVGCIIIKRTDTTGNWQVGFPEQGSLDWILGILELTNSMPSASYGQVFLGSKPTGTTVELIGNLTGWNESGGSYVMYLFAHDPLGPSEDGSDGLIACGSYTGNGSATGPVVDLGWEPQWLLVKRSDSTGDWNLIDNMRGFTAGGADAELNPNLSAAESTGTFVSPTSTGFQPNTTDAGYNASGGTYIYIAIRRGPMRAPESGTEVFAIDGENDTAPNPPTYNSGFPVDLSLMRRNVSGTESWYAYDRLRGSGPALQTNSTAAELTAGGSYNSFDSNTGLGTYTGTVYPNAFAWMFRRAPEFFDVVAYTGTGADLTLPHNLTVAPELIIAKVRNTGSSWGVATSNDWSKVLLLNSTNAQATASLFGTPDATNFYPTASGGFSGSGNTYIAYLFATLAGISKVGSYTGNGSSQTINCGFTSGARLVLIKATSTTGDWLIADTARGIVAGNDPYLELNTTNVEVTSEDWLDPDSSGFIVNEVAGSNANTSGVSYIYLAIS